MIEKIIFFLSLFVVAYNSNAQNVESETLSITVEANNISGGGFQGDVTITEDGQTVYSASDVSGISKSIDGGLRFNRIGEGLRSPQVASVAITPDNDQILYIGTGNQGSSGGLFRSINGGDSWQITAEGNKAQFSGNHSATADPVPDGHPRSNGDLIVVDEGFNPATFTDDIVIAGTYKDGVRIFTQGGDFEISAVNTNGFVRSVARNSAVPNIAYAAIQFTNSSQNGIYKIDYSNVSSPSSTLVYQTLRPEGLTVLSNGNVYAAIGPAGIAQFDDGVWALRNANLPITDQSPQWWSAVTGYVRGANDIVYAGANNIVGPGGQNFSNIWRTKDGGRNWEPLVDANTNVSDIILGQDHNWWFRSAFQQAGLGRRNSVVSSIDVARGPFPNGLADDIVYVSGRGGIWKSDNSGTNWQAAVHNLQVTANTRVAVNPNNPAQVAVSNTDYVVLETRNGFASESNDIGRDRPQGSESRGYDIIFDTTANDVIIGAGDRDTNFPGGGEVFFKSASTLGNPANSGWTNTHLTSATASNNGRVRAITYGYHDGDSETSRIILAAVEGEGVFRYQNGVWLRSSGVDIGATDRSNFIWPDRENAGVVYLLDLSAGFYRSNDGGRNWSNIWPSMQFNNNDFFNTGYLTADDNDPTTLYLSIQGRSGSPIGTGFRVFRMTGADTGVFGALDDQNITDISRHSNNETISRPGPIVLDPNGRLWLTEQPNATNSTTAGLYVMENPQSDTSFTEVTTNEYRNTAISPSGIDVSSDGFIYIAQNGAGVVKVRINEQSTSAANVDEICFPIKTRSGRVATFCL